jgi:hypothetical protein
MFYVYYSIDIQNFILVHQTEVEALLNINTSVKTRHTRLAQINAESTSGMQFSCYHNLNKRVTLYKILAKKTSIHQLRSEPAQPQINNHDEPTINRYHAH